MQKTANTGLYIKNKFFRCNQETGIIEIPQEVDQFSESVVLLRDGFAVKGDLSISNYSYSLDFNFLFNPEEIVPGRQAKFVFPITLLLNNKKVSLKQLSNVKLELKFEKNNSVTQKKDYLDLKLDDSKDLVIEAIVPSKVQRVTFTLSATLERKETINLQGSKTIDFFRINQGVLNHVILSKNLNEEYVITVIGANGEKVADHQLQLDLGFKTHTKKHTLILTTDKNGNINLGKLQECELIRVRGEKLNDQNFSLKIKNLYQLPQKIQVLQHQPF